MMAPEAVLRESLLAEWTLSDCRIVLPRHNGLFASAQLRSRTRERRPEVGPSTLLRLWQRTGNELRQPRQATLESADLQVLLIHRLTSRALEEVKVTSFQSDMIVVPSPAFVTSFAHPTPKPTYGLVLRRPGKLHLIHCVFLAEELAAMSAVDLSIRIAQSLATHRICAGIEA